MSVHIMTREAKVGSISSGTLKPDDLLEAFGWELQHISDTAAHQELAREARELSHAWTWGEDLDLEAEQERADHLLEALNDALNELAPAYCTFGANEGDGADFGFWPDMESIEELPRIADPADVPDGGTGEDCAFVNDHGNVTVYGADGDVILELV